MTGPLAGIRVLEMEGLGPTPFAGMVLADMGAEVIRIERVQRAGRPPSDPLMLRGRRSLCLDIKSRAGAQAVRALSGTADVLIEGFRPGVMERLGLGPDVCMDINPRLVYGRMTGWGQSGPLAQRAGHDINYIAVAGALEPIGRVGSAPVPPLALVGDFAGGGLVLALGVCAALLERAGSGAGQVIDAAAVDGASLLMMVVHGMRAQERWSDERGTNLFDSGAPYYDVYETADGRFVAFGAIEPKFYAALCEALELPTEMMYPQNDREAWAQRRVAISEVVRTRTRDEWDLHMQGREACYAPVLSPAEVATHPHHRAREAFRADRPWTEPSPAPRFGRTPSRPGDAAAASGQHSREVLREVGYADEDIDALLRDGVLGI